MRQDAGCRGNLAGRRIESRATLGEPDVGYGQLERESISNWLQGGKHGQDGLQTETRALAGHDVLGGSSFSIVKETDGNGVGTLWGQGCGLPVQWARWQGYSGWPGATCHPGG